MNNDEYTPLLRADASNTSRSARESQLPPISPTVRRVGTLEPEQIHLENLVNHDGLNFQDHPTEVAFALTILLHLRKTRTKASVADDLYEHWLVRENHTRSREVLEEQISEIWASFLTEYRNIHDIETVLWSRFPLDEGGARAYRVADFLADCDAPPGLISHPVVTSSLEHAWNRGVSSQYPASPTSSWLLRYDTLATPRVTHLIEWTFHLIFLALLVHYVLYPVKPPHTTNGWLQYQYGAREAFLVLLPLSFAPRSRSLANVSSLLVSFAFVASLPCMPHPGTFPFALMQWAVILHPFGLHLPEVPSHLFLLQRSSSLPLAILVKQAVFGVVGPVLLFFLPLLLLATYSLSLALVDTFLSLSSTAASSVTVTVPPIETRFTFLSFLFIVNILLFTSIFVLAATNSLPRPSSEAWDRYSEGIGHSARRALARATASYVDPYTFPPPFNLLHIVLVSVPRAVARYFGFQIPGMELVDRMLWRATVGPFTAFVSLLFWRPARSRPRTSRSESALAS
ncbi:hypothetical protein LshimejAT787_0306210 [Lyophyllum shimeji]|uniref:Uncharacterized protein n=1 Tax=Lyophyllum shimeji TaxID=47721 RepID=A0A9P3PJ07_LYOSH|nr:hypothetical protein LshimejAT787_0306210 [Lyophyllum shimeji]